MARQASGGSENQDSQASDVVYEKKKQRAAKRCQSKNRVTYIFYRHVKVDNFTIPNTSKKIINVFNVDFNLAVENLFLRTP